MESLFSEGEQKLSLLFYSKMSSKRCNSENHSAVTESRKAIGLHSTNWNPESEWRNMNMAFNKIHEIKTKIIREINVIRRLPRHFPFLFRFLIFEHAFLAFDFLFLLSFSFLSLGEALHAIVQTSIPSQEREARQFMARLDTVLWRGNLWYDKNKSTIIFEIKL